MKVEREAYSSVSEMVRDLTDPEFADDFDRHLAERQLIKMLTVLRCRKGLTQADLAQKMGCGQAKISKMEGSADFDLNFGDIVKYVRSLGGSMHLALLPVEATGADQIRFHVNAIKQELNKLVRIAGDVPAIGPGVEDLAIEQVQRLIQVVEKSLNHLPNRAQHPREPVSVEAELERGERLPNDAPIRRRVRRAAVEPVSPA
jgi:transcriptional regulator with XRE-family HTH domain